MLHRILRIRSSTLQNVRLQTTAAQSLGKPILTEEVNGKGVLILNRPEALNAVNLEMVETINQSLTKWQETHSLVLIKGAGQKAFSSGGDVPSIASAKDMSFKKKFFTIDYKTNYLIATLKIPYIALIDGITMGGGVGISVLGKYQVATERTLLAMPETSIGFFPDVGSSHFLQRLPGKIGLYIALTGARLKGKDIHEVGLATHYCNHEKLPQVERALLDVESSDDVEKVLNELCTVDRTGEYALAKYLDTINKCFDAPTIEDILVNLEKDGSDMAKKTIRVTSFDTTFSIQILIYSEPIFPSDSSSSFANQSENYTTTLRK